MKKNQGLITLIIAVVVIGGIFYSQNKPKGGFYLMPEFLDKKFKTSQEMCEDLLNNTGVALLPGSDFGISKERMIARLSFTDFNGENFMKNISNNENISFNAISKLAPKVVEGTKRLKDWVESN